MLTQGDQGRVAPTEAHRCMGLYSMLRIRDARACMASRCVARTRRIAQRSRGDRDAHGFVSLPCLTSTSLTPWFKITRCKRTSVRMNTNRWSTHSSSWLPLLSRFAPRAGLVIQRQTFVRCCHCRWRYGSPGSGAICGAAAVARNCRRRPRTHGRKRPRPLELGGEPGPGPKFAERIEHRPRSLCMWERCWRRREAFSLSHIIGPIPVSRSDPFRGFVRLRQRFVR
jgi:hypothetical protein